MVPGPGGFLFRASDKFEKGFRFSQVLMLGFVRFFLGALKVPSLGISQDGESFYGIVGFEV